MESVVGFESTIQALVVSVKVKNRDAAKRVAPMLVKSYEGMIKGCYWVPGPCRTDWKKVVEAG